MWPSLMQQTFWKQRLHLQIRIPLLLKDTLVKPLVSWHLSTEIFPDPRHVQSLSSQRRHALTYGWVSVTYSCLPSLLHCSLLASQMFSRPNATLRMSPLFKPTLWPQVFRGQHLALSLRQQSTLSQNSHCLHNILSCDLPVHQQC